MLCAGLSDQILLQRSRPNDLEPCCKHSFCHHLCRSITCEFHDRGLQSTCARNLSPPRHQPAFSHICSAQRPDMLDAPISRETYRLYESAILRRATNDCNSRPIAKIRVGFLPFDQLGGPVAFGCRTFFRGHHCCV